MSTLVKKIVLVIIFTFPCIALGDQVMRENLRGVKFTDKPYVVENAKTLLANANRDAYLISMPLIVSAQLGDDDLYQQTHAAMLQAMESRKNDTFTAWLYGRELLAATSMGNKSEDVSVATKKLKELLEQNKDSIDSFRAWALAYLAASNNGTYHETKKDMLALANKLPAGSDALWAWVMVSFAAANAQDNNTYHLALNNIRNIAGSASVAEALKIGLVRNANSNDYPAWAMGIVQLAAARMHDEKLFTELQQPLRESITAARNTNAIAEAILAIVNHELAKVQ
jgi:hypothetical protein